jgi:hypothetical protein
MVALKHLKSQAVSLQAFAPRVSGATAFVINRTLLKNPDGRYQSYDELIEHLEYARSELLAKGNMPVEKKRLVLETEEDQKLWSYLTFGMIAICLGLVGVFLYMKNNSSEEKPPAPAPPPTAESRTEESRAVETAPQTPPEPAPKVEEAAKTSVAKNDSTTVTGPVHYAVGPTKDASGTLTYETEELKVANTSGSPHRTITGGGFSKGEGTILDATQAGDYVTYVLPALPNGFYEIRVGVKAHETRGIWQLYGAKADAYDASVKPIGTPQDEYAPVDVYTEMSAGTWDPATTSDKLLRFKVTGKNPKSTGYSVSFDYIKLVPKPAVKK